jgi:hypothetical protein
LQRKLLDYNIINGYISDMSPRLKRTINNKMPLIVVVLIFLIALIMSIFFVFGSKEIYEKELIQQEYALAMVLENGTRVRAIRNDKCGNYPVMRLLNAGDLVYVLLSENEMVKVMEYIEAEEDQEYMTFIPMGCIHHSLLLLE